MPSPYDALFRFTLGQVEHARSLLRLLLPAVVREAIDWDSLLPCPETTTDTGLRLHHSDILYQAALRTAAAPPVFFVLEHKSGPDDELVRQLVRYVVHIERQRRRDETSHPHVVPVVLHHGSHPLGEPAWGTQDLDTPVGRALMSYWPRLRFLRLDLAACTEPDLLRQDLAALACVTLLFLQFIPGRSDDDVIAALERWGDLLAAVEAGIGGQQAQEALSSYLLFTTNLTPKVIDATFARILRKQTEESAMSTADRLLAQGRSEGRTEGRAEGRAALLLRLLAARFGPVPDAIAARLHAATADDLDRWAIAVLDAKSMASVFGTD